MRCIFCKEVSIDSTSVEHIIPESLGNTKNILPKGVVCDKCNNYFSVKIERPLLELPFYKQLRARNSIPSKKGRIPIEKLWFHHSMIPKNQIEIELHKPVRSIPILSIPQPFASLMLHSKPDEFIITSLASDIPPENNRLMARLLGKMALESLAQVCLNSNLEMNILTDDSRLDYLRNFTRFDKSIGEWPYHVRKLHEEMEEFFYADNLHVPVDVIYQYGLFFIKEEMYIVVILKGYEFALNLGGQSLASYHEWLNTNKGKSFLQNGNVL